MSDPLSRDPFNRDPFARYGVAEEMPVSGVRVRRITCNNASPMTFTGTQTYLVGDGAGIAVIDPGPENAAHLDAILTATSGQVSHIFVTHIHVDHSPGSAPLAATTGAPVIGFGGHGAGMSTIMRNLGQGGELGGGEGGHHTFIPDRTMSDGDVVVGDGWSLTALHTPGHLSNHLSFALGDTGVVFTGDTVMGWATTVVSPPGGDMTAFMASLARLAERQDTLFLPGHGHPVTEPAAMIAHQQAHRRTRATQILNALRAGPASAEMLAARIYTEVDPALVPAAARNVLSTLIWQMEEGIVMPDGPLTARSEFSLT